MYTIAMRDSLRVGELVTYLVWALLVHVPARIKAGPLFLLSSLSASHFSSLVFCNFQPHSVIPSPAMSRVFAILAILAIAVVSPVAAGPIRRDTDSEASPVPAVPTPVFTFSKCLLTFHTQ